MEILNLYNVELNKIKEMVPTVKEQKFDKIKTSILQPTKENHWYDFYKPTDITIGNRLGNEKDLKELCDYAKRYDIDIIVETIINQFNLDNEIHNHTQEKRLPAIENWNNREEVINGKIDGLWTPDIYNDEYLQKIYKFYKKLIDCGVKGIEIHGAKQIALPYEKFLLKDSGSTEFWNIIKYLSQNFNVDFYADLALSEKTLIRNYLEYAKAIVNRSSGIPQNPNCVVNTENYDSYYNYRTRYLSNNDINQMYDDLQTFFPSTEYFARPYDDGWKKTRVRIANEVNKK